MSGAGVAIMVAAAVFSRAVVGLLVLSVVGGAVSAIWLALLGDWSVIGVGVGVLLASAFVPALALLPRLLLMVRGVVCMAKGRERFAILCMLLGSIYTAAILALWCCGLLFLFLRNAPDGTLLLRLVWSYGAATGPWIILATRRRRRSGNGAYLPIPVAFVAQVAYLAVGLFAAFGVCQPAATVALFGGAMAVGVLLELAFVVRSRQGCEREDALCELAGVDPQQLCPCPDEEVGDPAQETPEEDNGRWLEARFDCPRCGAELGIGTEIPKREKIQTFCLHCGTGLLLQPKRRRRSKRRKS